ncbi:sodium-coupled monocarboxylate transporter 1-like [Patiria miniata]|uniref:Sodium/solute symporter n=1 Tax=Patiria miniata TaxID=46514 RepID=A0A913ZJC2_PATMI|nr:sodium-coupled monocarboxylate transporter 1-like [Patiria miniata]
MSYQELDQTRHVFQAADYAVCGAMLLASLGIGFYYGLRGGRQRTSAEYVLADRSMTVIPVTLSLLATMFSGISLQGFAADVYFRGTMLIWLIASNIVFSAVAFYVFVPMFYNLRITSIFEYLEARFNKAVTACGIFAFTLHSVLYMSLVSFTACTAATAVTGVSFGVAVVCVIGVCTIYTVMGGIKAVMWTDTIQMLLIFATIIIVVIKGNIEMGGVINVWQIAREGGRIELLNISPDPTEYYTVWGFLIGQLGAAAMVVCNQYLMQRFLACKSLAVAKTAVVGFMVGSTIFISLCVFGGVTLYAYYAGCDPTMRGHLNQPDELLPYFIIDVFHGVPGMAGVLLSGMLGAALSTLSSALNGVATLLGQHLVKPYVKNLSDERYTMVLKSLATLLAIIILGVTFLVPLIGGAVPTLLAIAGAVSGPILGIYLLGMFYPRCKAKGAFVGYLVGASIGIWLGVGNVLHGNRSAGILPLSIDDCPALNTTLETMTTTFDPSVYTTTSLDDSTSSVMTNPDEESGPIFGPLYSVSRIWFPTLTCFLTILVAAIITWIFGGNDLESVDPRLYVKLPKWGHCAWPFKACGRNKERGPPSDVKFEMQAPDNEPVSQQEEGENSPLQKLGISDTGPGVKCNHGRLRKDSKV